MSLSIDTISNRIKQYEEEIQKVIANHTGLVAALGELKQLLTVASGVAEVLVPSAVPVLAVAEKVANVIDGVVENN
jgi:hypothetical protein